MKKNSLPFALVFCLLFIPAAFAECNTPCPPPGPCMKSHPMPCDRGEAMGLMMICAMIKSQEDMKAVLKGVMLLQQRTLNASAKDKSKIKAEIDGLMKKLDAIPNMMDCPMMLHMSQDGCMDREGPPPNQTQERKQSPPQHHH